MARVWNVFYSRLVDYLHMRKLLRAFLFASSVISSSLAAANAQTAAASFDVATVKPAAALDPAAMAAQMRAGKMPKLGAQVEGSRAEYRYMSLRELIATAYRIQPYAVDGPEWMAQTRFDIVATMPAGAKKDDAPDMLKQLLAERFKLTDHTAVQDKAVLGLVVGKSGPKMQSAPPTPPIDEDAPLEAGEMKMDGIDGPMRIKINSDGSTRINMGVKGVITQKMGRREPEPAAECEQHLDGRVCDDADQADGGGRHGRQAGSWI